MVAKIVFGIVAWISGVYLLGWMIETIKNR